MQRNVDTVLKLLFKEFCAGQLIHDVSSFCFRWRFRQWRPCLFTSQVLGTCGVRVWSGQVGLFVTTIFSRQMGRKSTKCS